MVHYDEISFKYYSMWYVEYAGLISLIEIGKATLQKKENKLNI